MGDAPVQGDPPRPHGDSDNEPTFHELLRAGWLPPQPIQMQMGKGKKDSAGNPLPEEFTRKWAHAVKRLNTLESRRDSELRQGLAKIRRLCAFDEDVPPGAVERAVYLACAVWKKHPDFRALRWHRDGKAAPTIRYQALLVACICLAAEEHGRKDWPLLRLMVDSANRIYEIDRHAGKLRNPKLKDPLDPREVGRALEVVRGIDIASVVT